MVRQNAFNELMGQANVQNQGAQIGMQAQLANANLANQARQQAMQEQMSLAGLNRSDRQQVFGEQVSGANVSQAQRQQLFNEQLAGEGLTQAQREQLFNEQLSGFGANQQAGANQFNQSLAANQFNQGLQDQALQNQMAGQGFNQNLRSQQLQEQAYLQDRPLNLINALRTGNQVQSPQFQQFSQQATTQGPDMLNAANAQYQAAVAANNAKNAQTSGLLGGLMGIGMTAAGLPVAGGGSLGGNALGGLFSDKRLKTNIQAVGKLDNGLTVYSYRYKWGGPTQIGVMAQEVEQVNPSAVSEVGGYKMVDYGRL